MNRRYRFLRNRHKIRRIYKEFPYGGVSNYHLLNIIEGELKEGRDFILQF